MGPDRLAALRFRRRTDDVPSQKAHNVPLEIVYTAIPVLIVAILFFFTMRTQREITELTAEPGRDGRDHRLPVAVAVPLRGARRWPRPAITGASVGEPPELVLPVGETTRLRLVSEDVNHSFWVPQFLSKRDLIPGVRNEIDVTPNETGTFVGRCAEFCGLDHWRMNFSVRVVSQAEYEPGWPSRTTGGS